MIVKSSAKTAEKGGAAFQKALAQIQAGDIKPVYLLYGEEGYLQDIFISRLKQAWLGEDESGYGFSREDGKGMSQTRVTDIARQITFLSSRRLILIDDPAFIPQSKPKTDEGAAGNGGDRRDSGGDQREDGDYQREGGGNPGIYGDIGELSDPDDDDAWAADEAAFAGDHAKAYGSDTRIVPSSARADQALMEYMDDPAPGVCIVLRVRRAKPDRRHKLAARIAKGGGMVEAAAASPEQRSVYISEALRNTGKACDRVTLETLCRLPGGLATCIREVEKLAAYAGDSDTITIDMLRETLTPNVESDIFRMVDALGHRERASALRELWALFDKGESPFYVFSMTLRQFRIIFRAKAYLEEGIGRKKLGEAMGIHSYPAEKAAAQSEYFTYEALESAMELFLNADLMMKSVAAGEYKRIVNDLVINLGTI